MGEAALPPGAEFTQWATQVVRVSDACGAPRGSSDSQEEQPRSHGRISGYPSSWIASPTLEFTRRALPATTQAVDVSGARGLPDSARDEHSRLQGQASGYCSTWIESSPESAEQSQGMESSSGRLAARWPRWPLRSSWGNESSPQVVEATWADERVSLQSGRPVLRDQHWPGVGDHLSRRQNWPQEKPREDCRDQQSDLRCLQDGRGRRLLGPQEGLRDQHHWLSAQMTMWALEGQPRPGSQSSETAWPLEGKPWTGFHDQNPPDLLQPTPLLETTWPLEGKPWTGFHDQNPPDRLQQSAPPGGRQPHTRNWHQKAREGVHAQPQRREPPRRKKEAESHGGRTSRRLRTSFERLRPSSSGRGGDSLRRRCRDGRISSSRRHRSASERRLRHFRDVPIDARRDCQPSSSGFRVLKKERGDVEANAPADVAPPSCASRCRSTSRSSKEVVVDVCRGGADAEEDGSICETRFWERSQTHDVRQRKKRGKRGGQGRQRAGEKRARREEMQW